MSSIKGFAIRNGTKTHSRASSVASEHDIKVSPGMLALRSARTGSADGSARLDVVGGNTAPADFLKHQFETPPRISMPQARHRSWQSTGGGVDEGQNRDKQFADDLVQLVQQLNRSLHEAKRNGLIVEPSLSTTKSQFGGDGSDGHLLSVRVFRKLC